jgi:nucleotide-binding universal stress UspA family protein
MKLMIAVDGSPYSRAAARHVAKHVKWFAKAPEIHLVHVHPRLPYPGALSFAGKKAVEDYYRDESEAALKSAEAELRKAKLKFRSTWQVGDVAKELAAYAKKNRIDLAVMGSHGHGAVANVVLGSIATKCSAMLPVPILLVRK